MKHPHHRPAQGLAGIGTLLIGLLLAAVSLAANPAAPAAPSGLVAAYSFTEGTGTTVVDASGNGNNGTINGAIWTSAGQSGNGLVFNGTSALVTINDSASLHLTTGMTLEAWVNPSAVSSTWRDVIYKGNDNYYLEATSTHSAVPGGGGTFGGAGGVMFGAAALAANTWTHLAVTYDGTTLRWYVNGMLVASAAQTGNISTSASALQIGGDGIYGQYFQGTIDEVRVYNVALTAAQIQSDMNTPIGMALPDIQPPTGLIALTVSSTQVNLSWSASTGNAAVAAYLLERSQGLGSTNYAQVAAPTGTNYSDTGLAAATTYNYRMRATDAAGNPSGYSAVVSATTPTAPSGLVAAYSFAEGTGTTVVDASGNGNNGTINGAIWTSAGQSGNGLVFNGTSALVTINDSASLHLTTGMTLEAWVNPSAVSSTWRDVIYKGNDNYYLEATSTHSAVPGGGGTFGGAGGVMFGTAALTANTWSHLAVTYDGAALRWYVNGMLVASAAQTGNLLISTNALQIGGDGIYGQYFQGMIDEVRVYNVALTAAQIQSDMNTPIGIAPPDTQPPTAPSIPSGVVASADSTTQITVRWNASSDSGGSVAGYSVYRNGTLLAGTTATSYSDSRLNPATQCCYTIVAYDGAGNSSSASAQACATTPTIDTTPPSTPTGVIASATSETEVTVQWIASTDTGGPVQGYRVFRDGMVVALVTGTSFSDSGLTPGTQYCYLVDAFDYRFNHSSFSAQTCATTRTSADTTAPSVPGNVVPTADSTTQITVRWNASSDSGGSGLAGYRVYRSGTLVGTTASTSYSNSGLNPATQYCYTVVAFDGAGNSSSASAQACATTSSSPPVNSSAAVDEFVGPFATWADVQADYGAYGDGVHDDTAAFQAAFNDLNSSGHSPVLWIPAGTYRITQTLHLLNKQYVAVLGQDPANTVIDWQGAQSASVFWLDGVAESRFGRLTMRGNGAKVLIDQTCKNCSVFDSGNTYEDIVFTNAQTAFQGGVGASGPGPSAELSFRRCQFLSMSYIGINLGNANALDFWVWDSTFQNCARGIWTCQGGDAGFHLFRNLFIGSTITDAKICGKSFFTVAWNTSTGSVSFVQVDPAGALVLLQGNTVIDPQGTAVDVRNLGPVSMIDNTIVSRVGDTSPSVVVSNGAGINLLSVSNTFTVANPLKTDGGSGLMRVTSVDDTVVSRASLSLSLPQMPGVASNYNRTVYEVSGTGASGVQAAINAAVASGTRAVVHLPYNHYNIGSTLTVPANANLWITGDAHNPNLLDWGGGQGVPMWKIIGPTKVVLSDMQLNLYGGNGILCTNVDQVGSRVLLWKDWLIGAAVANLRAQNLANCRVELQDAYYQNTRDGRGTNGTSVIVDNAQVFNYGALSASNRTNYWVLNGGKLLLHTQWYEDSSGQNIWFGRVSDNSTVTFVSGRMANAPWLTGVYGISLTNFTGLATVLNFIPHDDITLEANSSGTNWIANCNRWNENGYTVNFNNKSTAGTQIVTGSVWHEPSANREYQIPDVGAVTAATVRRMLQHLRSDRPSMLTTNIASGATDILLLRMSPYGGSTGVEIKP